MRRDLRLLCNERGVDVDDAPLAKLHLPRRLLEKSFTRLIFPARIGVRKKVPDVRLAQRAQQRVADGVHQNVGVRVTVESLGVRDFDAAENELPPRDQLMNIVTDADMIHAR